MAVAGVEAKRPLIADFLPSGAVRRRILSVKSAQSDKIPFKALIYFGYFMAGHKLSTP